MNNMLTYTHAEMKVLIDKFLEHGEYYYCEADIDDDGRFTVIRNLYRDERHLAFIETFGEYDYEDKIYAIIFGIFARVERSKEYKIFFVRFD